MISAQSIYRIAFAVLLFFCAVDRMPAQSGERARGTVGLHVAVGSVNGVRLGLRYFAHPSIALEVAGGYMQVTLLRENERKEYTNGVTATLGGNWYTHPDAVISPMISLFGVYMVSATL
ncbi:MAG: hypothetical protein WC824_13015, partial [Bacteroidota bacterium]